MSDLSRLAPRRALQVAEDSFEFLRTHSAPLFGLTAVVVVPVQLALAYLTRADFTGHTFDGLTGGNLAGGYSGGTASSFGQASSPLGLVVAAVSISSILSYVSLAVVAGPTARMVAAWSTGRELSLREVLRLRPRMWLSLLVACILVHVSEVVGAVGLLVGALFPMVVFSVVSPVVCLEDTGPVRALRRSWLLVVRRFGPALGVVCAMTFVTYLFSEAVGLLPVMLPQLVGFTGGWIVAGIGQVLAKLVGFSSTAVFAAFLYIELRVRSEAMDLAVALAPAPR